MINTVKIQGNEYLVNGSMSVPNEPSNRHYQEVQEWLKTNTPEAEFSLDDLKVKKLQELKIEQVKSDTLNIDYLSTTFQADKDSQGMISSVLSVGSVPSGFYWQDKGDIQVPMTYTELQGLAGLILTRSQGNFTKYQTLKAQVNGATTQAELDVLVW